MSPLYKNDIRRSSVARKSTLSRLSIAYFLWDIDKQCRTRSDAMASDQALHYLRKGRSGVYKAE